MKLIYSNGRRVIDKIINYIIIKVYYSKYNFNNKFYAKNLFL